MEVDKILHMKEGVGQSSYANNSLLQRTIIIHTRPVIEESIRELYNSLQPQCLMIADMGCSSGPNALLIISEIIDVIDEACQRLNWQIPEIGVFLNDLPGNDFNTMFSLLPSFYKSVEEEKASKFRSCFVSGIPRSFYGRVFPDQFLHFVHSSYSLHWLSQVPQGLVSTKGIALNEGNICIAKTSPAEVQKAYYTQFRKDFTLFLTSRAKEMVHSGRMVLTFLGSIKSDDPGSIHELMGSTLHSMVLEGLIEEEKLSSFNMPIYSPTADEVRQLIEAEGSFVLNKLETFTVDWSVDTKENLNNQAISVADTIRAVTESLLVSAFGEATMNEFFLRFKTRVKERMARERSEYLNIVVSMTKAE